MAHFHTVAKNNFFVTATHGENGHIIETDAPVSAGGGGARFSPTDLVAAALLTCIQATMGVVAAKSGVDLSGSRGHVEKIPRTDKPHLIGAFAVTLNIPANPDADLRAKLERAAQNCPVSHALHPDIQKTIVIEWGV